MPRDKIKTYVQVLNAGALGHVVKHWQEWFDSKGLPHELMDTGEGMALHRGMTEREYKLYRQPAFA